MSGVGGVEPWKQWGKRALAHHWCRAVLPVSPVGTRPATPPAPTDIGGMVLPILMAAEFLL